MFQDVADAQRRVSIRSIGGRGGMTSTSLIHLKREDEGVASGPAAVATKQDEVHTQHVEF
jgi:hypothetical protein